MKKKMKRNLFFTLVLVFALCLFSENSSAQGLYGSSNKSEEKPSGPSGGGSLRDDWDEVDDPNEPGGDDDDPEIPISEGLLVLSILSGGYAIVKKRNAKNQGK
jgi:hypothetical protein